MSNIITTPIKDGGKVVAYVVPAEKYEDLIELEAIEDEYLAHRAKDALASGWASDEDSKTLLDDLDKVGK